MPPEKASVPVRHQHDDGRIDAREDNPGTVGVHADARVAAGFRSRRGAAYPAEELRRMPQHEGSRVSDEVGFVRRQDRAQEPEVAEFAEFREWRPLFRVDRERECRAILEEAKENQVLVINEGFDLLA